MADHVRSQSSEENRFMSEQPAKRSGWRLPHRPAPPAPLPRAKEGWQVAPAPDGRGMPEQHKPVPPHRLRGFWLFLVALLAINWLLVLVVHPSSGEPRVKVPFSPYFVQQVKAGEVKSISSKGDTIK